MPTAAQIADLPLTVRTDRHGRVWVVRRDRADLAWAPGFLRGTQRCLAPRGDTGA